MGLYLGMPKVDRYQRVVDPDAEVHALGQCEVSFRIPSLHSGAKARSKLAPLMQA